MVMVVMMAYCCMACITQIYIVVLFMSASQSLGDFNKLYNSCNTNINNSESVSYWRHASQDFERNCQIDFGTEYCDRQDASKYLRRSTTSLMMCSQNKPDTIAVSHKSGGPVFMESPGDAPLLDGQAFHTPGPGLLI